MNHVLIRKTLEKALEECEYSPEECRSDIAFHMTDWLNDLEEWNQFCQSPEKFKSEAVEELLMKFLIHVPNHLAAASKLMLDIPVTDIFKVGATSESDEEDAV